MFDPAQLFVETWLSQSVKDSLLVNHNNNQHVIMLTAHQPFEGISPL